MTTEAKASDRLIRALGPTENYFHGEITRGSSINTNSILFNSKHDLFENVPLVTRAVRLWKRTQPFLRCRVNQSNSGENQFVFVDDEQPTVDTAEKLPNVHFVYFDDPSGHFKAAESKDFWKMLVERELTIPIDWQNGPMWRLTFIDLNKRHPKNVKNGLVSEHFKYEYCLLISVSHALFDGLSALASLVSLFLITQALLDENLDEKDIVDSAVIEPVERYIHNYVHETGLESKLASFYHCRPFKRPTRLVMTDWAKERLSFNAVNGCGSGRKEGVDFSSGRLSAAGFFCHDDDQMFASLSDLVDISDRSVTKFHLTTFGGEQFQRFLANCKLHKVERLVNYRIT
ncbi:unnamed protein product [Sphagnum jensenii]|uniref:Alcohol acetyltransferase n=1 Tax=Sphagnum jensenii TaxID=128206 RepID=A0ABP0VDZ3_9BRYO